MQRQRAGRDLRLGGAHAPPARLTAARTASPKGCCGSIWCKMTGRAGRKSRADPAIPAGRRTPTRPLPAASLCPQVHARRRRTASGGGRGPRNPQRPVPIRARSSRPIPAVPSANRVAGISVAQIYRLLAAKRLPSAGGCSPRPGPRRCRSASGAGPIPQGQPGFLRVDTVHQGDRDTKGVYPINAVR